MKFSFSFRTYPKHTKRIIKKFLWIPVYISNGEKESGELRWLETAKILQGFNGVSWVSEKFL
jgi:hypothetical protein